MSPLSHPYFPILILSSLHLVIFRHPYLIHTKSNLKKISAINLALHFLHIYHLDFHLKKKPCLQTLRRYYGIISFSLYPLVEIIFYENQDGICFL
jgi:hypothetical protein